MGVTTVVRKMISARMIAVFLLLCIGGALILQFENDLRDRIVVATTGVQNGTPTVADVAAVVATIDEREPPRPNVMSAEGSGTSIIVRDTTIATVGSMPVIDIIRVDASGSTVIAGKAAPGSKVVLRLDGRKILDVAADPGGAFVSLFDIDVLNRPQILSVASYDVTGALRVAEESVIVAPIRTHSVTTFAVPSGVSSPPDFRSSRNIEAADPPPSTEESIDVSSNPAGIAVDRDDQHTPSTTPQLLPVESAPPLGRDGRIASLSSDTPAPPATDFVTPSSTSTSQDDRIMPRSSTSGAALRLFRLGPDGVSALDGAAAPAMRRTLTIDAISYDIAGEVRISGRTASDGPLRIYLDGVPALDAMADPDGVWSAPLPGLTAGLYTLRIDAIAPDGTVTARIETPFQRTAPDIAAAARRTGATAITVQPGFTLWAISEGYFGTGMRYVQLFEANRDLIRDPDLIFPGQVFTLPIVVPD